MWILTNSNTGQFYHLIPEKRRYVVGRSGTDIILKEDNSISRTHAVLEFQNSSDDSLILTDSGSKYGTFHNNGVVTNKKISSNEAIVLHNGDRIRFGLLDNVWKIKNVPFRSMSSCLPVNKARDFEQYLAKVGGVLINNWEANCTHLTMSEIAVTIKVLFALLGNVPIVSCEYWKDLFAAARNGQIALPRTELYLPKKSDLLMNKNDIDFGPLLNRKSLFCGKTFIFLNKKQYEMYGPIVQMAGGTYKNLNCSVKNTVLTMSNVIVIQYVPSTQSQSTQTINSISDYLESKSRRIIPEYEIGLAIVHCSIEKYCNPAYKISSDLLPSTSSMGCEESESGSVESSHGTNAVTIAESDLEVPETDSTTLTLGPVHIENKINSNETPNLTEPESQFETDEFHIASNVKVDKENSKKRKRPSNNSIVLDDEENEYADDPLPAKKKCNFTGLSSATLEGQSEEKDKSNDFLEKKQEPILTLRNEQKAHSTARVSTAGFLNKTQATKPATKTDCTVSNGGKSSKESPKRGRIALITDDESGDENDLFNFGNANKSNAIAKKRRIEKDHTPNFEDSEDDIFTFSKQCESSENIESEDFEPTQEFVGNKIVKKTTYTPLIQPKILPQKVSTAGWLSSSLSKLNIKQLQEEDVGIIDILKKDDSNSSLPGKEKKKLDDDSVEEKKGKIVLSGFDVRFSAIPRRFKEKLQNSSSNHSSRSNQSNSGVNFKVFVKKRNYKPQIQVIKCSHSVC